MQDLLLRDDVPLLTLTGPGGVGKTRLALHAAAEAAGHFPDGIVFVPLAPIRDPALVIVAIARALDLWEVGEQPLEDRLTKVLRDQSLLLVLDNFEHILAATTVVATLLTDCPRLQILVTSRTLLRLSGEQAFPVPPLSVPDPGEVGSVEEVAATEAVRLFVARARAAQPAFVLTHANIAAFAAICRQVDGLPLALELAAARVSHLPPAALLARLERRLPLLRGGPRDQPARLQTMRDAIAWSYGLLTADEQALFRRVAVFVGGFDIEAAAAVNRGVAGGSLSSSPLLDSSVLDGVASLVDHSLLRLHEQPGGEPRYFMLETIREFGLGQLAASDEEAATRAAHAAYFLELAERAAVAFYTAEETSWFDRLETEHANLRGAVDWAVQHGQRDHLVRLACALWWFWRGRGHFSEGTAWLGHAVAVSLEVPLAVRARIACAAGTFAFFTQDLPVAESLLGQAIMLARAADDPRSLAQATMFLALVAADRGELDRAETLAAEVTQCWRALGDGPGIVQAVGTQGHVAWCHGAYELARAFGEEALALARAIEFGWGVSVILRVLAGIARRRGDYGTAAAHYAESLALAWTQGDKLEMADDLARLATIAALLGQPERAARLMGSTTTLCKALGVPLLTPTRPDYERAVATTRAALGETRFAVAEDTGRCLPLADAVAAAAAIAAGATGSTTETVRGREKDHGLTPREIEVLRLIAAGQSNREIGDALCISERTVENHVLHILTKLEVSSRTAAAACAIRQGLR